MIDANIDVSDLQSMSDAEFIRLANTSGAGGFVNVIEVKGGWAAFGPGGVYRSSAGKCVYEDLAELHEIVRRWGLKRFVQGGHIKEF